MHDSVKRSAAAGQRGRQSSANMFDFNDPYMTSSDSVQVKAEPQEYAHQSTFSYEMAHGLPLTPSVSAHGWQDQSIPGTTACYNTTVSAPDYSGLTYYQNQQYTDPSMIDPVSMQYPVYSSSGQVQALYYQSGYDVNQNRHPEYVQIPSRRWPMTPQSHVGTPERTHHPSPSENTWPSPILSGENAESKRRTIDKNVNSVSRRAHLESLERSPSHETESITSSESSQEMFYYGSVSPSAFTTEIGSSRREKSATRGQAQAELDPELRCPLCDKTGTSLQELWEDLWAENGLEAALYDNTKKMAVQSESQDRKRENTDLWCMRFSTLSNFLRDNGRLRLYKYPVLRVPDYITLGLEQFPDISTIDSTTGKIQPLLLTNWYSSYAAISGLLR
uniref:Uncharacterized protein n=1 Tax=Talaromyces marneffei PM1 TaxID=1077442 RepID=A0A093UZ27_TALMA